MSARTKGRVTRPDGTTELERPYHHGNLREELIAVSMALGEEGGPDVITLREAARRAGVAANAAYRHFDDLRHLRAEVALRARARLAEAMREELDRRPPRPTAAASAREELAAVGRGYIRFALRSPNLFRCAWMECPTPDPEPSAWSTLHEALDACARAGVLPGGKTEAAAAAAWSLVHGFAELALRGLLGAPTEQALDELGVRVVEVFLNGALTNGSQRG